MAAKACLAATVVMAATVRPELRARKARAGGRVRSHLRRSPWGHPSEHRSCSGRSFGGSRVPPGGATPPPFQSAGVGRGGLWVEGVSQSQGIRKPDPSAQHFRSAPCRRQQPGRLGGLGMVYGVPFCTPLWLLISPLRPPTPRTAWAARGARAAWRGRSRGGYRTCRGVLGAPAISLQCQAIRESSASASRRTPTLRPRDAE